VARKFRIEGAGDLGLRARATQRSRACDFSSTTPAEHDAAHAPRSPETRRVADMLAPPPACAVAWSSMAAIRSQNGRLSHPGSTGINSCLAGLPDLRAFATTLSFLCLICRFTHCYHGARRRQPVQLAAIAFVHSRFSEQVSAAGRETARFDPLLAAFAKSSAFPGGRRAAPR